MNSSVLFFTVAKKTCLYFLLPVFTFVTISPSKAQNLIFAKGLKNLIPLGGNVVGGSIFIDNAGNTYVTGTFKLTADFDPGAGRADLTSGGNTSDIFIAKYDGSGNYQYAKRLGGLNEDFVTDIAVDVSGNAYITGYFSGIADFDPGAGTVALTSAGGEDMFIAKYDASGNYLFAKVLGNSGSDLGRGIALDGLSNIYITGSFTDTVDFDPGTGMATLTSTGAEDIFIAKYDPLGNYLYAKAMAGSDEIGEGAESIAVDNSGNTYITGYFDETVDFDPGVGTANLVSSGNGDIFIAKYDASGNYVFARGIGSTGSDHGAGIAFDASGYVYITGFFEETVDFDPDAGTSNLVSTGFTDIFVAKYDAVGSYVYANGMGSTSLDFGGDIAVDLTGNAYVTGHFEITVDFDPGAGTATLTSSGGPDIFVAKYNASGNYVYAKRVGGGGTDISNSIALDGSGDTYFTGAFSGTADFDPGAGTAALTIDGTGSNAFVSRFNNNGDYVKAIQLGNYSLNGSSNLGFAIAVDASGNSYITGSFSGTVDFDPGTGVANLTGAGAQNLFIAKYDASGNYIYAKAVGGTGNSNGNGIAIDGSGNLYITGYFSGTADFDPGVGTAALTSAGSSDIFIAGYDASGNYVYAKAIGGTSFEQAYSIALDGSGNIYVTGYFTGTSDFDPGASISNLVSAGDRDIFVAKYDGSGSYIYAKRIGGANRDFGYGIAVDNLGNTYVAGSITNTVDLIAGAGTVTLTSAGLQDIFIVKYDASGNYIFAKAIGGTSREEAAAIAIDAAGNVYLTGYFTGVADFDPDAGMANLTSSGGDDIFIAKYDASGNYVYAKAISGTSNERGFGIVVDVSGNAYITGIFYDIVDFDAGIGTVNLNSEYDGDIFVAKYDGSGNYIYAKAAGGATGGGEGVGIAVDGSGNAYVTGSFSYTADFNPGSGSANSILTAINGSDIFIAKYGTSSGLPVHLLSFTAKPVHNNRYVQVNWRTASQTNNAYFDVERGKDGVHFEPIGRRQGCLTCTDTRHYELNDNNPYVGISYYRLKQVDHDGKFSYSPVALVNMPKSLYSTLQIYPNITDGAYSIKITNPDAKKQAVIQLINAEGRPLHKQTLQLNEGDNTFNYSLSEQAPGIYYIRLTDKLTNTASTVMIIRK